MPTTVPASVTSLESLAQEDARAAIRQGATAPWGDGVVLDGDGKRQVSKVLRRDLTDDDVRLYVRTFVATIEAEAPAQTSEGR